MTPQYIFDTTWKHLVQQGVPSSNSNGMCRYRSPDGTKCAIGALIPDEQYLPRMENRSASHLIDAFFPEWEPLSDLMDRIQEAHDEQRYHQELDLSLLQDRFLGIASKFDLNPKILDEVR